MGYDDWDGRPLGCDTLSLIEMDIGDGRTLPIFAAGTGATSCVVRHRQVAGFLLAHSGSLVVCHDAGTIFWTIADLLDPARDRVALNALWDLPREGHLRDIKLLDQLIREAGHPARPHAASLPELARRVQGLNLADDVTFQPQTGTKATSPGRFDDPARLDELVRRAGAVLAVYRVLAGSADRIIRERGIDPATIERFGPLALDIQVRGAIALAAAGRAELSMDESTRQEVVRAIEAVRQRSIDLLWADVEARRCFKRDGAGPKFTATGFPQFRERSLELWLEALAASMACLHAIPYTPPQSSAGRTSTDPSEWEFWARCHPLLRAWSDLIAASKLRHRYGRPDRPSHRLFYELIPNIRSIGPELDQLRDLGVRPAFRPRPRHTFLVVALPDLESRALAAICSLRGGLGGRKAMAEIFQCGGDIRSATAARLLFMGREVFDTLERRDPELHRHGLKLAEMLLYAAPRGIDPGLLRSIVKDVFAVSPIPCPLPKGIGQSAAPQDIQYRIWTDRTEMTIEEAHRRFRQILYHELVDYLHDDALEALAQNLGISFGECAEEFGLDNEFESTSNALRKLLMGSESGHSTGRHLAWRRRVWRGLREHDPDGRWEASTAPEQGSPAIYAELLGRDVVTPAGRVHGKLDYPTARSRPFTSLAGDAAKAALFAVVAAGHRLVAYADEEFVVEVPAWADLEAVRIEVEHLAGRAAEVVLDGVPVPCKGEFRAGW